MVAQCMSLTLAIAGNRQLSLLSGITEYIRTQTFQLDNHLNKLLPRQDAFSL
jgi:hypothetical protein